MQNSLEIATRYLFLSMAIKNFELDLQHIHHGKFKIKEPYMELIEKVISKAISERRQLKRIMYQRKIQVVFMHRQGDYSTYKFIIGRKENNKTYMNPVIKKNVEKIMKELLENN